MPAEVVTLLYGLSSALTWGAGDFSGGLASKRTHVLVVVLLAQCIGTLSLFGVALGVAEPLPPVSDLFIAAVGGTGGIVGLIAFYHGLARYQMGPMASVTAAISTLVPIAISACLESIPGTTNVLGFVLAITAIWMITRTATARAIQLRSLTSSLIAGLGFATFFIAIGLSSRTSVLWIVVGGRSAALILLAMVMGLMRRRWKNPVPRQLPLIALAGLFDTAGNTFYALAASTGRLDTAVVLASLYPATTVLLAWALLKEHLPPRQWMGILTALCAVVLLSL